MMARMMELIHGHGSDEEPSSEDEELPEAVVVDTRKLEDKKELLEWFII